MKTIAFALDPDGYWIELIPRAAPHVAAASSEKHLEHEDARALQLASLFVPSAATLSAPSLSPSWPASPSAEGTAKSTGLPFDEPFNLSQTMLRVRDKAASLNFYQKLLGFSLVRAASFDDFSLSFLAALEEKENPQKEAKANLPDPHVANEAAKT
eukprot:GHVT01081620.1.p2 GENE.GHVT01081620.1~~GHVT01081620.1.p2  ORF type:complete len:156 (-),score=49.01 GHVT01081620.1:1507-1974(-)